MKNIKALVELNRQLLNAGKGCGGGSMCDTCAGQIFPSCEEYETLIAAAEQGIKDIEENR